MVSPAGGAGAGAGPLHPPHLAHPKIPPATEVGSKAHNLFLLKEHLVGVEVPGFIALGNTQVRAFLEEALPDLKGDWARFCALISSKTLSLEARAILAHIRSRIAHAFMSKEPPFIPPMGAKKLMVRSSSAEDSLTSANAGGNLSLPCDPDKASLVAAIQEVICSYFSEKSLEQRLLAGEDITPFPLCSVLIQELIGEEEGMIPVSFVMFSQESGMDTKALVHIQASYGHGEGVVESKVAFDSYYMRQGHLESVVVADKKQRLRKGAGSDLVYVENPKTLQAKPCLAPEALVALHRAAREIEHLYGGKGMDIEGVVMGAKVYIVQARPLVAKKEAKASFVDETKLPKDTQVRNVRLIAEGQGAAFVCEYGLIDETLDEALVYYLKLPEEDQKEVQVIVVRQMAAVTSHAATIFRAKAIPIVCIKEKLPEGKFVFDVQRQKLFALQGDIPEGLIQEGRIAFPLANEQTVLPLTEAQAKAVGRVLPKEAQTKEEKELSFRAIFDLIGSLAPQAAQIEAVERLMRKVINLGKKGVPKEVIGQSLKNLATIKEKLAGVVTDEVRKQILLAKKVLEATLFQESSSAIVGSSSLKTFFIDVKRKKEASIFWERHECRDEEAKKVYCELFPLYHMVLAESSKVAFELALYQIASSGDKALIRAFIEGIKLASEQKILPYLLNTIVTDDPIMLVTEIHKMVRDVASHSAIFEAFKPALTFEPRLSQWQDPAQFDTLFRQWHGAVHNVLSAGFACVGEEGLAEGLSGAFIQAWGKQLVDFIDLFDRSIKEMKASPLYTEELKIARFRQMLDLYAEVMEKCCTALTKEQSVGLGIRHREEQNGPSYLGQRLAPHQIPLAYARHIRAALSTKSPALRELIPSSHFSVSGAVMGSGALLERQYFCYLTAMFHPLTLEDLFTLIHQNMLVMVQTASTRAQLPLARLPSCMQELMRNIHTIPGAHLSFVDSSLFPKVVIRVNIPQRNHSSFIDVDYNAMTKEVGVEMHVVGQNTDRGHRLSRIAAHMLVEGVNIGLVPESYQLMGAMGVAFKWTMKMSQLESFQTLIPIFAGLLDTTMEGNALGIRSLKNTEALALFEKKPALKKDIVRALSYYGDDEQIEKQLKELIERQRKTKDFLEIVRSDEPLFNVLRPLILDAAGELKSFEDMPHIRTLWKKIIEADLGMHTWDLFTARAHLDTLHLEATKFSFMHLLVECSPPSQIASLYGKGLVMAMTRSPLAVVPTGFIEEGVVWAAPFFEGSPLAEPVKARFIKLLLIGDHGFEFIFQEGRFSSRAPPYRAEIEQVYHVLAKMIQAGVLDASYVKKLVRHLSYHAAILDAEGKMTLIATVLLNVLGPAEYLHRAARKIKEDLLEIIETKGKDSEEFKLLQEKFPGCEKLLEEQ